MGIDVIKTIFSYAVMGFVVVGGFVYLFLTRGDPAGGDTQLLVGGFIGAAMAFMANQQIQSATAHQTNVAATNLNSAGPNTTVNASGPTTVQGGDPTLVSTGLDSGGAAEPDL